MNGSSREGSRLVDLADDECWELVSTRPVGRLAWRGSEGLSVVPVNFVISGGNVHVRTTAYSAVARECDDSPVAFQVDHFDEVGRSGWSVLLRGRAHLDLRGPVLRDPQAHPDVWPAGSRALHLTVTVDQVSGRRLQSA